MSIPCDPKPLLVTTATNGKATLARVPVIHRGAIRRLRVMQTAGTLSGFTFQLYSRYEAARAAAALSWGAVAAGAGDLAAFNGLALAPAPVNVGYTEASPAAPSATVPGASLDPSWLPELAPLYAITPLRTVTAAAGDDPAGYNLDYPYTNNDYCDPTGVLLKSTSQRAWLYLVVTPVGAGAAAKSYYLDLCVEDPTNL